SYYDEDVRLMPAFQKTVLGKTNVLTYYKAFLDRFDIQDYTMTSIEILDLGAQVMEIGNLTMKMQLRSTGQSITLFGAYMNIWKVIKNDKPMLITAAWNYDEYYDKVHDSLRFEAVPAVHIALNGNVPITNNISFELAAFNRLLD